MLYALLAVLAASSTVFAVGEACAVGTCMSPYNCLNVAPVGAVSTELCPGGENNKCCDFYGPTYKSGTKSKGTLLIDRCLRIQVWENKADALSRYLQVHESGLFGRHLADGTVSVWK